MEDTKTTKMVDGLEFVACDIHVVWARKQGKYMQFITSNENKMYGQKVDKFTTPGRQNEDDFKL